MADRNWFAKRTYFDMGAGSKDGIVRAWQEDGQAPEGEQTPSPISDIVDLREPIVALQAYKRNFDLIDWSK